MATDSRDHRGTNTERSKFYGSLQAVVDALFEQDADDDEAQIARLLVEAGVEEPPSVRRLDVVIAAEAADLPDDLMRIVNLLPPGSYTRQKLCDQLNSAIVGHAWGQVYGTVI